MILLAESTEYPYLNLNSYSMLLKIVKEIVAFIVILCYKLSFERMCIFMSSCLIFVRSIWYRQKISIVGAHVIFKKSFYLVGGSFVEIGDDVIFGKGCVLTAWGKFRNQTFTPLIKIGNGIRFGQYNHITSIRGIVIGNNLLTGRWVTITDNSHGTSDYNTLCINPSDRLLYSKGIVKIGNNVWLGDKVTILPGVTIGDGVIVGANSVVAHDLPNYCIAAGVPAKIVKYVYPQK